MNKYLLEQRENNQKRHKFMFKKLSITHISNIHSSIQSAIVEEFLKSFIS